MNTSFGTEMIPQAELEVGATNVRFDQEMLTIELNDGRQIALPYRQISWLCWFADATNEQRAKWSIEPFGYAIWWEELDDGIEVVHALSHSPLSYRQHKSDGMMEYA